MLIREAIMARMNLMRKVLLKQVKQTGKTTSRRILQRSKTLKAISTNYKKTSR